MKKVQPLSGRGEIKQEGKRTEIINSSVNAFLIDMVWTEHGKTNRGNSIQQEHISTIPCTFLLLNNNRFSMKVWIIPRKRAGTKTNYAHPMDVNILVLLSCLIVVVMHIEIVYI